MTESGEKVVVTSGEWRCHDGTTAGPGDVGWVVGHMGMNTAVVHFDKAEGGTTADIPEVNLRTLTPRSGGR